MNGKYKVSLLIPTYNQVNYIEKAILSAVSQDYENLEVIVSDDNSTDSTEGLVNKLLVNYPKLKYFKNSENIGRVKNYHKSLYEYATGDLVLNIDGDDYLIDSNYISKAVKLFSENKDIVLVCARKKIFLENKRIFIEDKISDSSEILDGNSIFLNYYKGQHISHLTSLYKRDYAMQVGYYQEDIKSSDWDSVLRLILNNKVGFINKTVGVWRKHATNTSKEINIDDIISNTKFVENAYNEAISLKIANDKILIKWREKMLVRMFLNFIVKIIYLEPKQLKPLLLRIDKYDKNISFKIKYDIKYIIFRLIYRRTKIVGLIFKYILKKETFVSDLQ